MFTGSNINSNSAANDSVFPEINSEQKESGPHESRSSAGLGDRVFRNVLTLILGRGFGLVLSGAASILLARYLGREDLGRYGALYAYAGLYGWLATFGLESILAREAAKERERAGSILLTGVVVSSGFTLLATALAVLLAAFFGYRGELQLLLALAAIDILILSPLRLPGIVFQVDLRQWYGVGISLARQFLWLAILLVLAFIKASLVWVIIGRAICSGFEVGVTLLATYHRGFLARPWQFIPSRAKEYARYGFPIAVSALAVGVYHRIDQVMLHNMTGDRVLGGYVAAVNVTELFGLFPVALMTSMFPVLSQFAHDNEKFDHYLKLSFRSMMVIAFGACVIVSPLADPIVRLLYGAKFQEAGPLLSALIWSEVPVFFGVVLTNAVVAKNLQRFLPWCTATGAIVNVALNLVLIPRFGAMGSVWATNVSYSLAAVFLMLAFTGTRSMTLLGLRISIAPLVLSLLIAAVFLKWRVPVLVEISLIVSAYALGLWTTGSIHRREVERLKELIGESLAFVRPRTT
jgi:O-antigen/teichoic acid export membrane protein